MIESGFTTTGPPTIVALLILLFLPNSYSFRIPRDFTIKVPESDIDLLEFPLNLEFLEAEFFLYGSLGYGLDKVAPNLTKGGPPPIGGKIANLDHFTRDIILQFALQEVGHLRFSSIFYFPSYFSFNFVTQF